ncbi:DnaA N-terminal domain-containing protein [Marivita sp. GX14005]|uniref:helix-turn-helix domain-containing protein n=1 Tax=Marivita sp. GX14005 TaxID=2942276 RepID=UPI0020187197|nr:DnaA N-terminal domain-containing protein [Marivita sp. GX14005]MCL3883223.1 helix-turn-helix domain-containing protein [Marivita sp. GX14005]
MQQARPVGRTGAAVKYDILTALMALACNDRDVDGRLAARLVLLITARFNWQRGSFACGQREIARMWGVTERTAKRELAAMRARGWITLRRPAARGRVAEHAIDLDEVLRATRAHWAAVGPDFVARMGAGREETPAEPAPGNVVPFRAGAAGQGGGLWASASARLGRSDPALHAAWFAPLVETGCEGGKLTLKAPSKFAASYIQTHLAGRLLAAVSSENSGITWVDVTG